MWSNNFSLFHPSSGLIGGVLIVIRRQLSVLPGGVVVGAVGDGLHHGDHAPHGRAVDGEWGGAEESYVEDCAYLILEARIKPRVDHVLHALLVHRGAHPFHQVLLPKLWIHGMLPCDKLQNHHPEAVCVALLVHTKRVTVF